MPTFYICVFISIGIALIIFWLCQVLSLMQMNDDTFPGRFDKLTWGIILSITFVLGAIAFAIWKAIIAQKYEINAVASQLTEILQNSNVPKDSDKNYSNMNSDQSVTGT